MRDLHNNLSIAIAKTVAAITTNTTTNGAVVDLQGFGSVEFSIHSGTLTDGSYAINVQHGDLANGSDMADAPASALLGAEPTFALTDDDTVKTVGYVGSKRYVRIQIVSTSVTTGGTLGATAIRSRQRHTGGKAV
jgi:hypothetical protein